MLRWIWCVPIQSWITSRIEVFVLWRLTRKWFANFWSIFSNTLHNYPCFNWNKASYFADPFKADFVTWMLLLSFLLKTHRIASSLAVVYSTHAYTWGHPMPGKTLRPRCLPTPHVRYSTPFRKCGILNLTIVTHDKAIHFKFLHQKTLRLVRELSSRSCYTILYYKVT